MAESAAAQPRGLASQPCRSSGCGQGHRRQCRQPQWLVPTGEALGAWASDHAAPLLGNFWVTATICAGLSLCRPRLAVAAALLFDALVSRDLTEDRDGLAVFRDGSFAFADSYYVAHSGSAPPDCFRIDDGEPTRCDGLASMLDEARERLHVSDLVIRENLVPVVVSPAPPRPAAAPVTRPALQD